MRRASLALLAACASAGNPATPDAASDASDAATDSGPPSNTVTVTVSGDGQPIVARVAFTDSSGGIIALGMTDATGVATRDLPQGGVVTVVIGGDVYTYLDVHAGDSLRVVHDTMPAPTIATTLSVPADPGAGQYDVHALCGGGGSASFATTSGPLSITDCGGTADFIVFSESGGAIAHGLVQTNVTIAPATPLTASYQAPASSTTTLLSFSNAGQASSVVVAGAQATPRGALSFGTATVPLASGAGGTALSAPKLADPSLRDVVATQVKTGFPTQTIIDIGPPAGTYALDVGAALLPTYQDAPMFDIQNRRLRWVELTSGAQPDLTVATVAFQRGQTAWTWHLAGPYVHNAAQFPVLPILDNLDYNAKAGDGVTIVRLQLVKAFSGYNGIRTQALSTNLHGPLALPFPIDFDASTAGRIVTSF